ncbi:MAG: 4-hydroxyphenylacetate 3-monooxygenase [Solirubrobacteraceae bacterium]|nr:4-hydroxyphenylacetate 3-monooxygenase [Solirubrobacteraceae bacterium]
MRTGAVYRASLDDGRAVFVDGGRVTNVAEAPAFAGVVDTIAGLYDAAAEQFEMQLRHPDLGVTMNRVYIQPRSIEDLRTRREAITRWAERTNGFVGRSPDHVGGFFAGFASAPSVFDDAREGTGANAARLYRRMVEEDLYLSYTIIPPQNAVAKPGEPGSGRVAQVAVAEERPDGMLVRGAQMLGTGSAVSDLLFVSCIKPLRPDETDQAVSFVVPIATEGLRLHCRRPYAVGQPSSFDYPLSTRFDEPDAMVVFDDVLVPWEDVLVCRDVAMVRDQFHRTAAHVLGNTQAQIRFTTKLKFLLGLAASVVEANSLGKVPAVVDKMGELAALASFVEGMVLAAESTAAADEFGIFRPNRRFLYGAMGLQSELYPRVLHVLRELSGAGVIGTPSSYRDLVSPQTEPDMSGFLAESHEDAEARTKLFKLVWDAVGSEFAGRHHQYEMFYAGAPFVARGYAQRNYGFEEAQALAQRFLDSYSLDEHSPLATAPR